MTGGTRRSTPWLSLPQCSSAAARDSPLEALHDPVRIGGSRDAGCCVQDGASGAPSTPAGPLPLIQYCFRTYGGARGSRLSWRIYPRSTRNSVQRGIARVIGYVILQSVDVLLCFRTYGSEWET